MRLTLHQRNWLLSFHIATGSVWLGSALASVALAFLATGLAQAEAVYGVNVSRNVLGEYVIVPAAVLVVITGALLCGFTHWGFFKHYWLIAKELTTLALIAVGSVWLGPLAQQITELSRPEHVSTLQSSAYMSLQDTVMLGGVLQTLALLAIVAMSTVKPWGRRSTKNPKKTL